jgi:ribosomal-protein-alanine N-acetyltransferase
MKRQKTIDFRIEKMQDDDIPAVNSIETESFSNPWPMESFYQTANDPAVDSWVLFFDAEVIGYFIGMETEDGYLIANLAVSGAYRKKGIASRLMEYAIERIDSRKIDRIFLDVRQSNSAAIQLYRKFGFSAIGKRKGYYLHPLEDSVVMLRYNQIPPE